MKKEMIYRVYNKDEKIFECRLDSKEKKMFTAKGYIVVKTGSYVKSY